MSGLFITGTDTGVGKTCVSVALLHLLSAQGWRVAGFKPVAAGTSESGDNEDVEALQAASSIPVNREQVGPYQFRAACAPHLAAQMQGVSLPRRGWQARAQALGDELDMIIAEGAGGFCVPLGLNPRWGLDDVAAELQWPVILVVGLRLGCINHSLLTMQAIASRGLTLAGWVCNRIDPHMPWADDNLASLKSLLPAPCWGDIPWMPAPHPAQAAAALDSALILRTLKK